MLGPLCLHGIAWHFPRHSDFTLPSSLPRRGRNRSALGNALGEGIHIQIQALKERYILPKGIRWKL
jgi:hypothetical protein